VFKVAESKFSLHHTIKSYGGMEV